MSTFGKRLQQLMDEKKINQKVVVEKLGFHKSQVSKWISAKTGTPRRDTLQKISEYFGCNIEWLAKGTGEMFFKKNLISLGAGGDDDDDDDDDDEYEKFEDNKNVGDSVVPKEKHYKENDAPRQGHPFGRRLQYLLDEKKIKEVDAAKEIGIVGYKFKHLLDGHVFRPNLYTIQRISNFFGCDIDWLADGKGEPFPGKTSLSSKEPIENRMVSLTSEPETKTVRMYRKLAQMDSDTLGEIQTWLNDMERLRPGFTSWFRLEFQNRFPEFDEWKRKVMKK